MNPKEYRYTKEHEWVFLEKGNLGKVGLTEYAQSQLGDIVYLDLPAPGTLLAQFQKLGEVESVKAFSEIFSPVSGKVVAINHEVAGKPELVNKDPYGAGWLIRVELKNPSELNALMNSDKYDELILELTKEK